MGYPKGAKRCTFVQSYADDTVLDATDWKPVKCRKMVVYAADQAAPTLFCETHLPPVEVPAEVVDGPYTE